MSVAHHPAHPDQADIRLSRIIEFASGQSNGSLRTHLDEWAAFHFGGDLLTPSGRQRWFNNPCPWKEGDRLLRYMDWFSLGAASILRRGISRDPAVRKPPRGVEAPFRLIVEHAVPVRVIGEVIGASPMLREKGSLVEFLLHHFKRAVLTEAENQIVATGTASEGRLISKMPHSWLPWGDPFSRYRAVGLV